MAQKNTDPQRHSQNLFSLLQEFVNYLGYEGQDPSTIRNNFNLVKNYLNWYGFEIYSEAVKSRLNFPKKIEEEAYPITLEDIKKLPKSESTDFNKMKKIAGLKAKHQEEDNFFRMRIKAGFGELRYDNGIHKITLHSFRSWFITKCNRIDSDFGNALGGHQKYMKKYNRFTDQELCDLFIKAENTLSIFERVDEDQEKRIEVLSKDLEKTKKEIELMRDSEKSKEIMKDAFLNSEMSDTAGVLLLKDAHKLLKTLIKENKDFRKKLNLKNYND